MGTENRIFYKLKKWGICKHQYVNMLADSEKKHIGCGKDNDPFNDICRLDDCEFKYGIIELAAEINTIIDNAKKQGKGKK